MKQTIDFNYIEDSQKEAAQVQAPYCFHNCDVNRY